MGFECDGENKGWCKEELRCDGWWLGGVDQQSLQQLRDGIEDAIPQKRDVKLEYILFSNWDAHVYHASLALQRSESSFVHNQKSTFVDREVNKNGSKVRGGFRALTRPFFIIFS